MNKLIIKTGKTFNLIDTSDIDYIRSERSYCRIYCNSRNYVIRKSLNQILERLGKDGFLRINKSTIVNMEMIREMKEIDYNKYSVILKNDEAFDWGREYKKDLVSLIKL